MQGIKHILVVDDDDRIRNLLVKFLTKEGYFISCSADTEQAREKLATHIFDLIILDVMMPNETGVEFTKWIRKNSKVPILMLTAMDEIDDIVMGLDSGADDYLPKPFDPRELLARIRKLISRNASTSYEINNIQFGKFLYNKLRKSITSEDDEMFLSSGETSLLDYLIDRKNSTVTRQDLSKLLGGISERSVDVQINRLRAKIEKDIKKPIYLKTIRGEGYLLRIS